MKSLIAVLIGVVIMLLVFSCATAPTEPLASGELRLLSMEVPGHITAGFPYDLIIIFRADGKPEISKACCDWSGGGPYCFKAGHLKYGSPGNFIIELPPADPGQYTVECYAEYLRDGETQRTNVVDYVIDAMTAGPGH
ncbi:MAG: hypothetical protein ACLQHW_02635 [bacterium]